MGGPKKVTQIEKKTSLPVFDRKFVNESVSKAKRTLALCYQQKQYYDLQLNYLHRSNGTNLLAAKTS